MGSPYAVSTVPRVTVVRTISGLERALSSVASFGDNRSACRKVVALLVDKLKTIQFMDTYVVKIENRKSLKDCASCIYDWDVYDNLFPVLVDIAAEFCEAFVTKSRRVVVVEPRYEWIGFEKFGVAIVIDLTARTPSVGEGLSTGV